MNCGRHTIACEVGCCPHCADARAVAKHEAARDEYWRKRFEEARKKRGKPKGDGYR